MRAPLDWARIRDQVITAVAGLVFLYASIWLLGHVLRVVVLVLVAVVVAAALGPVVSRLEEHLNRGAAALVTYLMLFALVGAILVLFGSEIARQSSSLSRQLPEWFDRLGAAVSGAAGRYGLPVPWIDHNTATSQVSRSVQTGFREVAINALNLAALAAGGLVDLVIVLVLAFYFLADGPRLRRSLLVVIPERHRDKARFVEEAVGTVLGSYIRGQLVLAAVVATGAGLGCWILGVRYPLAIAALAFGFELIPMLGPVLTALPAVFIALFQPFPLVVWVVIFFVGLQMVENHVLAPRVQGRAVGVHPVVALLALTTGAELFGVWGALLAVPVAGVVSVLVPAAFTSWRGEAVDLQRGGVRLRLPRRRAAPRPAP